MVEATTPEHRSWFNKSVSRLALDCSSVWPLMLSAYAMTTYRITVRDDGDPAEGVERHASMEAARRSAVRSAVRIFMDTRDWTIR
jgi:hypothetical protein